MSSSSDRAFFQNGILRQLSTSERDTLLADAEPVRFPTGSIVARAGDAIASTYFPESGVICPMNEMATGHQLAMVAIGCDGVIGLGPLFSVPRYPHRLVSVVESTGHRVQVGRLVEMFQRSERLRRVTLAHVGRLIRDLSMSGACHRLHSHRQRLARWLLIMTDKAGQRSLHVTHEAMAQMVGGPRHAVTVALSEFRAKGAIAHVRGRVGILKRSVLVAQSCECYRPRESSSP